MAGAVRDIVEWTVSAGLDELGQSDLMAGYCERLVEARVPLWRASIGADTLHPLIDAQGHRWLAGEGVREEFIFRSSAPAREDEWRRSPWYRMVKQTKGSCDADSPLVKARTSFHSWRTWPPRVQRTRPPFPVRQFIPATRSSKSAP